MSDSVVDKRRRQLVEFTTIATIFVSTLGTIVIAGAALRHALTVFIALLVALLAWRTPVYRKTWRLWRTRIEALLVSITVVIAAALLVISSEGQVKGTPTPIPDPAPTTTPLAPTTTPSAQATGLTNEIRFVNIEDGSLVHYHHLLRGVGFPEDDEELWIYGIDPYNLVYSMAPVQTGEGENWYACAQAGVQENVGNEFVLMVVRVPLDMVHEVPQHKFLKRLPTRLNGQVTQLVRVKRADDAGRNC